MVLPSQIQKKKKQATESATSFSAQKKQYCLKYLVKVNYYIFFLSFECLISIHILRLTITKQQLNKRVSFSFYKLSVTLKLLLAIRLVGKRKRENGK